MRSDAKKNLKIIDDDNHMNNKSSNRQSVSSQRNKNQKFKANQTNHRRLLALLVCISSLGHSLRVQCAFKWHNNHHKWTSSRLQCPKIVVFMCLTVQRTLLLLLLLLLLLAIASALRTQCPNVVSVTNPPKTQLISNGCNSFCVVLRTTMSLLWMNEIVVNVNRTDNPLLALAHSLTRSVLLMTFIQTNNDYSTERTNSSDHASKCSFFLTFFHFGLLLLRFVCFVFLLFP